MPPLPRIDGSEGLDGLAAKLRSFFVQVIDAPHEWEELRRERYVTHLRPLVRYLAEDVRHELVVCALLALKWQFAAEEREDERGVYETRGLACELVAWRYVTYLSQHEALEALCSDVPAVSAPASDERQRAADAEATLLDDSEDEGVATAAFANGDESPLLCTSAVEDSLYEERVLFPEHVREARIASVLAGLNAMEIAAVAEAKKFLRQKAIQRIIDGIWTGDIVFWETLSAHSTKQIFEACFFVAFLAFYYTVLVQKHTSHITFAEVMLYVWLASFTYNELGEFWDAGSVFYATDFWSLWDLGIIAIGVAFFVTRVVGLVNDNARTAVTAFDILSVEALFLVPRLHPYFGMLMPALKEMTKDFTKFLGIVVILYLGFTTCFAFLARGMLSFRHMNWILIKVFFGSSYLGFDISEQISPVLGPVLMVIFVALTNVLLITSMISLLSNTLTKFMQHAGDEYHFVYAVYVLEASTSNRLTYFLPPLNLLPLLCLRPLRLIAPAQALRTARITLLKATHWPFVALILGYEAGRVYLTQARGDKRRAAPIWTAAAWGRSLPPRLRHASSPVSLIRRPRSRLATGVALRVQLDEQLRAAQSPSLTHGKSGDGDLAPAGHGAAAARSVVAPVPPSVPLTDRATITATSTADVPGLASVVANLREQVEQLTRALDALGARKDMATMQTSGSDGDRV